MMLWGKRALNVCLLVLKSTVSALGQLVHVLKNQWRTSGSSRWPPCDIRCACSHFTALTHVWSYSGPPTAPFGIFPHEVVSSDWAFPCVLRTRTCTPGARG